MSEKLLIQQAKEGVASSFSQLVILYQKRLFHYLLARCQNQQDAEDVLQDTFISAYKYLKSYDSQWKFSTWLFTIANRLIKKQKLQYNQNDDISEHTLTSSTITLTVDEDNIWIQVKKILKPQAYDVLWFFYVEELKIYEIAKVLQHSQSWVKISLYRSKKKLAKSHKIQLISKDFLTRV